MRLTCRCDSMEKTASLDLKLAYYVYNRPGPEFRMVYIQHCSELYIRLDFRGVDATNFPVYFRSLQKLHIEAINLEQTYTDRQELQLHFYNVQQIHLSNLIVQDTFKMHAENIKEARIANSTFAHIPVKGMIISQANLLDIQDSTFLRVAQQSIIVEKTKKVHRVQKSKILTAAHSRTWQRKNSDLILW